VAEPIEKRLRFRMRHKFPCKGNKHNGDRTGGEKKRRKAPTALKAAMHAAQPAVCLVVDGLSGRGRYVHE
jgi:hypothetical protein